MTYQNILTNVQNIFQQSYWAVSGDTASMTIYEQDSTIYCKYELDGNLIHLATVYDGDFDADLFDAQIDTVDRGLIPFIDSKVTLPIQFEANTINTIKMLKIYTYVNQFEDAEDTIGVFGSVFNGAVAIHILSLDNGCLHIETKLSKYIKWASVIKSTKLKPDFEHNYIKKYLMQHIIEIVDAAFGYVNEEQLSHMSDLMLTSFVEQARNL